MRDETRIALITAVMGLSALIVLVFADHFNRQVEATSIPLTPQQRIDEVFEFFPSEPGKKGDRLRPAPTPAFNTPAGRFDPWVKGPLPNEA